MSDTLKHLLIAALFAIVALVIMVITNIVPPFWQPIVTFTVFYGSHYILENPTVIDSLIPGAPPTGPPTPSSTTGATTYPSPGN